MLLSNTGRGVEDKQKEIQAKLREVQVQRDQSTKDSLSRLNNYHESLSIILSAP